MSDAIKQAVYEAWPLYGFLMKNGLWIILGMGAAFGAVRLTLNILSRSAGAPIGVARIAWRCFAGAATGVGVAGALVLIALALASPDVQRMTPAHVESVSPDILVGRWRAAADEVAVIERLLSDESAVLKAEENSSGALEYRLVLASRSRDVAFHGMTGVALAAPIRLSMSESRKAAFEAALRKRLPRAAAAMSDPATNRALP